MSHCITIGGEPICIGDVIHLNIFYEQYYYNQLVQIDQLPHERELSFIFHFEGERYRITSKMPQFHFGYMSEGRDYTIQPPLPAKYAGKLLLEGRKIWYNYDKQHVTPKPPGPYPRPVPDGYAGSNLVGKWVTKHSGTVAYVLPFDHYGPAGAGTEEHGPPTISVSKLVIWAITAICKIPTMGIIPKNLMGHADTYIHLTPRELDEQLLAELLKEIEKALARFGDKCKGQDPINVLLFILHITNDVIPTLTNTYVQNRFIYKDTKVGENNIVDYYKLAEQYRN